MTKKDPDPAKMPQPVQPASPRLDLPWMQALIAAGAGLSDTDASDQIAAGQANNAVHYIRCGSGPKNAGAGTDFLTAVSRARQLISTGARRIVFLTTEDRPDGPLRHSLTSFSRHAGRALPARPTEFAVVPVIPANPTEPAP
ncbi:MAG: hypothetical protein Q7J44_04255 [Pseudotabrizicola sp.]|uniref:hypothetical protein n=1 Tax=Pseudotabrizicola sp. TaxID=2939647 RepID=UPI0027274F75|nr:hypothetical protein [Pseudotabrizicola sp.]MDO9637732.1 hypothetical protein [Pseudotabrizicola sp.]